MKRDRSLMQSNQESSKIPSDYPEIPRPSKWKELVFELKLVGIGSVVIALIWALDHFANG